MSDRELLIKGGQVVDGTGAPGRSADVRVRGGRIVEVGPGLDADGAEVFDAAGAVVAPGFIDTHAHTDPQVFWDPTLDPEPLHGVTTMLVGNCSLSLYPALDDDGRRQISDLFAYIEDVPRHLFDEAVPWTWTDYAGYRDTVNAQGAGTNLAALVGHSPLRLAVMGDDAWTRAATSEESAAMALLLDTAMADGAWGLSTSHLDVDAHGRPVPSRYADGAEYDTLLDAVAAYKRGLVEMVPALLGNDAETEMEDLARRCGARGLPLTWTGFVHPDGRPQVLDKWLGLARRLQADGIGFWPQLSPRPIDFRLNWDSSMMFMSMPKGWHRVIAARGADKAALLADPDWRDTARAEWDATEKAMFPHQRPYLVKFVEVVGEANERWLGKSLKDLMRETGQHPSDAFADFVLANDCRPGIVAQGISNADVEGVARTLRDPAVLVSSSDAGAHMQMLCASGDTTLLLTRHVRERGDFTLEEAIWQLTGRQAATFGFTNRGRVAEGCHADLVVFDPDELHYDAESFVADLPRDGRRLRRPEGGYRATFVRGVATQLGGVLTGSLPGRVLHAGEV